MKDHPAYSISRSIVNDDLGDMISCFNQTLNDVYEVLHLKKKQIAIVLFVSFPVVVALSLCVCLCVVRVSILCCDIQWEYAVWRVQPTN